MSTPVQSPKPRGTADQVRDPISALLASAVALMSSTGLLDRFGDNAERVALELYAFFVAAVSVIFIVINSRRDSRVKSEIVTAIQDAFRAGLHTPPPNPQPSAPASPSSSSSRSGVIQALALVLGLGLVATSSACMTGPDGQRTIHPELATIVGRVDVIRVAECRELLPDWSRVAQCVGAQAATPVLRAAFERVMRLLDRLPNPRAGAELAPDDDAKASVELDGALDELGAAISETW